MKNELIQTAIAMWQEHGYNNVSINQICKNCGVTKGSFYHHFVNKESVILEYYNHALDNARLNLNENDSYIDQIFELIKISTVPIMKLNSDLIMVLLTSPQIKEAYNYLQTSFNDSFVYRHMVNCCRKGQDAGEIRNTFTADQLIDTVLIAMTGNVYRWVVDNKRFDLLKKDKEELVIILKN